VIDPRLSGITTFAIECLHITGLEELQDITAQCSIEHLQHILKEYRVLGPLSSLCNGHILDELRIGVVAEITVNLVVACTFVRNTSVDFASKQRLLVRSSSGCLHHLLFCQQCFLED
jgi:hypothetical protein